MRRRRTDELDSGAGSRLTGLRLHGCDVAADVGRRFRIESNRHWGEVLVEQTRSFTARAVRFTVHVGVISRDEWAEQLRVRPYYLHQMDVAQGLEHLRTPITAGIEILEQLRGHTTGLAVPHLAVDLPGGGGKVTLQPQYVLERGEKQTVFRNYHNERYVYPEPEETDCSCPYDEVWRSRRPRS